MNDSTQKSDQKSDQKPEVEYPCRWGYKVIGTEQEAVEVAARECVDNCLGSDLESRDMKLDPSRKSAGGKYVSWSLSLRVDSLAERDALFAALSAHVAVKMVI